MLLVSICAAGSFALFVSLLFDGDSRWFLLYYFTPIGIPFVAFLFDRTEGQGTTSIGVWTVDLIVLLPALARAFVRIPLVSGHALFLTYCLLTSRSNVARVTAALVMLQVAYLKILVTHDTALIGGIIGGVSAPSSIDGSRPGLFFLTKLDKASFGTRKTRTPRNLRAFR